MLGEDKKLTAKDFTAEILYDEKFFNDIDEEDGFEYNAEIEELCTYNSSMLNTEVTAFLDIYWGRNVGMSKVLLY